MAALRPLRSLWDARKGFRWSLYFVKKDEGLRYALHENSVVLLLEYVLGPLENGKQLSSDWELHINFNWQHKAIKLEERHFQNGAIDRNLITEISTIDPGWKVTGGKPVFVDAITRKSLPLGWSYEAAFQRPEDRLGSVRQLFESRESDEVTLATVMRQVFVEGK